MVLWTVWHKCHLALNCKVINVSEQYDCCKFSAPKGGVRLLQGNDETRGDGILPESCRDIFWNKQF